MSALVYIVAGICITIITVAALATGHDNVIVTGGTGALVGLAAAYAAFRKGKSSGVKQAAKDNEFDLQKQVRAALLTAEIIREKEKEHDDSETKGSV